MLLFNQKNATCFDLLMYKYRWKPLLTITPSYFRLFYLLCIGFISGIRHLIPFWYFGANI